MKKIDGFFVTIVTLVVALSGMFYYTYASLNYFDNNPELLAKYERKKSLAVLAQKLEKIAKANQITATTARNIASVSETDKELGSESGIENKLDGNELAKKYYLTAKTKCYELNKELECLRTIEAAVTHFPESSWTAESLVLLTDFYYRTKRISQAREIIKILKQNFKNDKSIHEKVIVVEKALI